MPDAPERRRLGRYETLFRIAAGGMAEVYAARALGEAGFQKLVAIKLIRPELAEDARFVTMFLDEGRLAANINSPNVVSTIDLGRGEDNALYLVLELVVGVPLSTLVTETRVPIPIAVAIIAQAATGLHDAHEARSPTGEPLEIVHRDCSPHNILVDVGGAVKITDFGIAKAMERQTQSQAGEMKGKLAYLSPEQAMGRPVDRRTDIFILGIDAWELFAGRQLFEAQSPVEALHKVGTMPIPRLDEVAGVPTPIADAVAQALAREPAERFATAAAFGNALLNALGHQPPARAEIGAFVRKHGGASVTNVEEGIRAALGGSKLRTPSPPPLEHDRTDPDDVRATDPSDAPIPLATRKSSSPPPSAAVEVPHIPPPARIPDTGVSIPLEEEPEPRRRVRTAPLPRVRERKQVVAMDEPIAPPKRAGVPWMLAPIALVGLGVIVLGAWYFGRPAEPPIAEQPHHVASPPPRVEPQPVPLPRTLPPPVVDPPAPPVIDPPAPAPDPIVQRPPARPRPPIVRPRVEPSVPGTPRIGDDPQVRGDNAQALDEIQAALRRRQQGQRPAPPR